MTDTEILQKQTDILREVLGNPDLMLKPETTAADVENWDSLAHIRVIVEIEKAFKVRFALGEIQGLKNVGEMTALIRRRLG